MINGKRLTYLMVCVFLLSSLYIFFHPVWLREFPQLELYRGELSFSGENALSKLKELAEKYSGRVIGSQAGIASAEWIREEFLKLGLEVKMEEFRCAVLMPGMKGFGDNLYTRKNKYVSGINVKAISHGKSNEVVIIGAHRDVAGDIQGAEDNASGTASMLELARVLCGQEHYYTYMFVSFDGEESGKLGSKNFASLYRKLPVKLAYILDMTGYYKANTLGFYPYIDGKGAAPLWTLVLGSNILSEQGLRENYSEEATIIDENSWDLFYWMLSSKLFGHINTDSEAFTDGNIPAIALMAAFDKSRADSGEVIVRKVHSPADTTVQVSAETLQMTGRFSERYIRSLELNSFRGELLGGYYCIAGSQYLSPVYIAAYLISVFLLFALLVCMELKAKAVKTDKLLEFICSEKFYLILSAGFALTITVLIQIMRIDLFKFIPRNARGAFLLIIVAAGSFYLILRRNKSLHGMVQRFREFTGMQMVFLNLLYSAVTVGLLILLNPFKVICLMVLPFLFIGRAEYRTPLSRTLWIVFFIIWSGAELWIAKVCLQGLLSELGSIHTALIVFLCAFMWTCTFIYIVSAPPVPKAQELYLKGRWFFKG